MECNGKSAWSSAAGEASRIAVSPTCGYPQRSGYDRPVPWTPLRIWRAHPRHVIPFALARLRVSSTSVRARNAHATDARTSIRRHNTHMTLVAQVSAAFRACFSNEACQPHHSVNWCKWRRSTNWLTVMPMDIPHSTPVHTGNILSNS